MITKAITFSTLSLASLLVVFTFITSTDYTQLLFASVFYAIVAFLLYIVYSKPVIKKEIILKHDSQTGSLPQSETSQTMVLDIERRAFLKFVGATSLSFFVFSLLGRRFENIIFDGQSKPLPASNAPLENEALNDKYKISEIDEQSDVTYYGFTTSEGQWFIMKEESEGSFRYVKGDSDFNSNWSKRGQLEYDYYHSIFK